MTTTNVKFVCGKTNTIEYEVWSAWLKKAGHLVDRHILYVEDDDPFAYNETASVALLASAAALAGYAALAEYSTKKLPLEGADAKKRAQRERNGRGDLWLFTDKREWAFEFKQRLSVGHSRAAGRLKSKLEAAKRCASQVIAENDGKPVAALIVSLYFVDDDEVAFRAAEEIERFAKSQMAYCWRLTPPDDRRSTFFLFKTM